MTNDLISHWSFVDFISDPHIVAMSVSQNSDFAFEFNHRVARPFEWPEPTIVGNPTRQLVFGFWRFADLVNETRVPRILSVCNGSERGSPGTGIAIGPALFTA